MQFGQNTWAPLRGVREPLDLVARDGVADLVLGQLTLAALAPVGVLRLDHLIDVLHHEEAHGHRDASDHYQRKRIHDTRAESSPDLELTNVGPMPDAYVIDAVRTPIGRYGGTLANARPDDLGAHVVRAVVERNELPEDEIEEVVMGCTNQAGEDNRNVARMAL